MRAIATGLWQLRGWPRDLFNVYLAGDVLVDAATRWARRRLLRQLRGRPVRLLALTHCHPDHQGSAHALCRQLGVSLACHEADAPAVEGRTPEAAAAVARWQAAYRQEWEGRAAVDAFGPVLQEMCEADLDSQMAELRGQVARLGL